MEDKEWITYYSLQTLIMQIYLTTALKARNVLEIGKGYHGFISSILRRYCNLTTLDFVEEFKPNLLIDITNLKELDTIMNNAFDLILICEVLEHIPYEKIDKILEVLKRKTKKYLIISVPDRTTYINLILFNHNSKRLKPLKNYFNSFFLKIQKLISKLDYSIRGKHKKFIPNKQEVEWHNHQWELGVDKYNVKSFRQLLGKHFKIVREERVKDYPTHHFFILKKK